MNNGWLCGTVYGRGRYLAAPLVHVKNQDEDTRIGARRATASSHIRFGITGSV